MGWVHIGPGGTSTTCRYYGSFNAIKKPAKRELDGQKS